MKTPLFGCMPAMTSCLQLASPERPALADLAAPRQGQHIVRDWASSQLPYFQSLDAGAVLHDCFGKDAQHSFLMLIFGCGAVSVVGASCGRYSPVWLLRSV